MTTDIADAAKVPAAISASFQQIVAHCGRLNLESLTAAGAPTPREDARALQDKLYREVGVAAVAAALKLPVSSDPEILASPMDEWSDASYRGETRAA